MIGEENITIIKGMLTKLKDKGKTLIISEHRIFYLMDIIDRVFLIQDGKIKKAYTKTNFIPLSVEPPPCLKVIFATGNFVSRLPLEARPLMAMALKSTSHCIFFIFLDVCLNPGRARKTGDTQQDHGAR